MQRDRSIELRGITKSFGEVHALREVDLDVPSGTVGCVLGPNGAGKTTLVRIVATLATMDRGTGRVAGLDLATEGHRIRERIRLTGQFAALDDLLTGRENLEVIARLARLDRRAARRESGQLLDRFDLVDAASRRVSTYSGGMRRRLDLAASLLGQPDVIVLDEPTTGLDPRSRQTLWTIVRELVAEGTTIVLTTQHLEEADVLADHITLIDRGAVVASGSPRDLKSRLGSDTAILTFEDGCTYDRARAHLAGRTELHGHDDELRLSLPTDATSTTLAALLDELHRAGAPATRVELTAPTLDDVFLQLTAPTTGTTR
jgi:ABC-2 type transport system ATP-binding protein